MIALADHGRIRLLGQAPYKVCQTACVDVETGLFWATYSVGGDPERGVLTASKINPGHPVAASSPEKIGHGHSMFPIGGDEFIFSGMNEGALRVDRVALSAGSVNKSFARSMDVFGAGYTKTQVADGGPTEAHVAVRGRKATGGDTVRIFDRSEFIAWAKGGPVAQHEGQFNLQGPGSVWFQNSCLYRGHVITWRGDADLYTPKLLRKYDLTGNLLDEYDFIEFRAEAREEGSKYEPEGLFTFQGELLATIALGEDGACRNYYVNLSRYLPGWF